MSIYNLEPADLVRVKQLAAKYRDLDRDFDDLALLALAERLGSAAVLTLDARDFTVYRLRNGKPLVNLLPGVA